MVGETYCVAAALSLLSTLPMAIVSLFKRFLRAKNTPLSGVEASPGQQECSRLP